MRGCLKDQPAGLVSGLSGAADARPRIGRPGGYFNYLPSESRRYHEQVRATWRGFALAVAVLGIGALAPRPAVADEARFMVFGGVAAGGVAKPTIEFGDETATSKADSESRGPGWMVSVGAVGRSGSVGGGGELFMASGSGFGGNGGYTGVVTYAGLASDRVIMQAGVGIGALWKLRDDPGVALAGGLHARLGVRVNDRWVLLGRSDLALGWDSFGAIATVGLLWTPK